MNKIKNKVPVVARVLLGLVFLIFGLNGFFNFIPMAPPQGAAGQFMGGLAAAGYFFPLLKATEVTVGLLLLSGRFVPLALVLLAPVMVNIVGFHVALAPAGLGMALFLVALHGFLVWSYWGVLGTLLQGKVEPRQAAVASPAPAPAE